MRPRLDTPGTPEPAPDVVYRCGPAARWLPRALAASVLAGAMLAGSRIDPSVAPLVPFVRQFVILAGAVLAVMIVRKGGEVRFSFGLTRDALIVAAGKRTARLELSRVKRVDYEAPMGGSMNWVPATVLIDDEGRGWRVPSLVERGDRLIVDLLGRAARNDLDAWADAHHVVPRMGRYSLRVRAGYALVAIVLVASLAYYLH